MLAGVYKAQKKNGNIYYRSNITYKNKHISLGSFETELLAHQAYLAATKILSAGKQELMIDMLEMYPILKHEKIVSLLNFKKNGVYIKNPIFLYKTYFEYYLSPYEILKFDIDDLFYYSSHKIIKRGGHMYVNDYGMQYNILSRYGIKNHAIAQKDYIFINNDSNDFRYENIKIVNAFYGVTKIVKPNKSIYQTKIHINGYFIVGNYSNEVHAAIAYNKAVDFAKTYGYEKNFPTNFIDSLSAYEYAQIYSSIHLSKKYSTYLKNN